MEIPKEKDETFIIDKREDNIVRNIQIDLVLSTESLSKDIEALYRKILKLEKTT
jgi:hypothetical protein